jgi:hypothetical protein
MKNFKLSMALNTGDLGMLCMVGSCCPLSMKENLSFKHVVH